MVNVTVLHLCITSEFYEVLLKLETISKWTEATALLTLINFLVITMKNIVFFFLYFHVMKADLAFNSYPLISSHNGHITRNPIPSNCSIILEDFADSASTFTKCSIKHAIPITLCAECVKQYLNFRNNYNQLLTTTVDGISCKSLFISHDTLDAVLEYHDSILAVWDKGHCSECFNWIEDKPVLSNETETFRRKLNATMLCIDGTNTETVCETCMFTYIDLDEFYKSLSTDSIGVDSVCMDIVDSMNATRYIWSKVLNCCKLRKSPEIIFLCCTAIVAVLPLLFYVAVRFCGPIRDLPNVLKQSRFKQIILRSTDGEIN